MLDALAALANTPLPVGSWWVYDATRMFLLFNALLGGAFAALRWRQTGLLTLFFSVPPAFAVAAYLALQLLVYGQLNATPTYGALFLHVSLALHFFNALRVATLLMLTERRCRRAERALGAGRPLPPGRGPYSREEERCSKP